MRKSNKHKTTFTTTELRKVFKFNNTNHKPFGCQSLVTANEKKIFFVKFRAHKCARNFCVRFPERRKKRETLLSFLLYVYHRKKQKQKIQAKPKVKRNIMKEILRAPLAKQNHCTHSRNRNNFKSIIISTIVPENFYILQLQQYNLVFDCNNTNDIFKQKIVRKQTKMKIYNSHNWRKTENFKKITIHTIEAETNQI